ncbi:tectonin beta-propeller repeat-containing protein 1 [Octopus bimaculoides]|uniref:Peroxin/Ferlin domain-containing protein n=1 Tax=Octopus bimaculoides TaxID=37653 RepID=A0A0L8GRD6_OCTBM|nr:tectonin beta-propeller repeat-containing protein 1 [Octopus bimaculoides]|eukprot:XP_014778842.1 PREDICTED: tectonin beta-propeller repeat-containing protein 1-like [Octopus bimaculoides]
MLGSPLWLVSWDGNVFTLFTKAKYVQQVNKSSSEYTSHFKRISATPDCAWGLSCYHQIYVYVYPLEIPIRIQDKTYENERWTPVNGFSGKNLLPTERKNWSDESGEGYYPKDCFELPSQYWEWEGDWSVDENFRGHLTDRGGWQYAANFPSYWTQDIKWNSCVRKRKWIRFRRYTAVDCWAKIPDLTIESHKEAFIDIAVGGFELPNQPLGHLCVWAVTVDGQVFVRSGVTRDCPEGKTWDHIGTNSQSIINISIGPTARVWSVTWDGTAYVRLGVSRDSVYGTQWIEVSPPSASAKLMQVAVGKDTVWALSRDGQVWFRKGIRESDVENDLSAVTGTIWVEMVGLMSVISVGPNDQVFGIGLNSEAVYFRFGVKPDELSGKTWQPLQINLPPDRHSISDTDSISAAFLGHSSSVDNSFDITGSTPCVNLDENSAECATFYSHQMIREQLFGNDYSYPPMVGGSLPGRFTNITEQSSSESLMSRSEGSIWYEGTSCKTSIYNPSDIENLHMSTSQTTPTHHVAGSKVIAQKDSDEERTKEKEVCICKVSEQSATDDSKFKADDRFDVTLKICPVCHKVVYKKFFQSNLLDSHEECSEKTTKPTKDTSDVILNFVTDLLDEEESGTTGESSSDVSCEALESSASSGFSIPPVDYVTCNSVDPLIIEDMPLFMSEELKKKENSSNQSKPTKDQTKCSVDEISKSKNQPEQSRVPESAIIPYRRTDEEQDIFSGDSEKLTWRWVSAMSCLIDKPSSVCWLSASRRHTTGSTSSIIDDSTILLAPALRTTILQRLQTRNYKEVTLFAHMEHAVEKVSWIKKGSLYWLENPQKSKWIECNVEFEQGMDTVCEPSTFTIHYVVKSNHMHLQIPLNEVLCTCRISEPLRQYQMAIHVSPEVSHTSPILLSSINEADIDDWVSTLNISSVSKHRYLSLGVQPGAVWSTMVRGDIFVYDPTNSMSDSSSSGTLKNFSPKWIPVGGHLHLVETNPLNISWGIGYDSSAWVYTGGFGGDILKSVSDASWRVHPQVDVRSVYIYENQKWTPAYGYSNRGFMADGHDWSDRSGRYKRTKENTQLPSGQWIWMTDWIIDYSVPGGVDPEGWQYSTDFNRPFHRRKGWTDTVRRRRWYRKCKISTRGPWLEIGPTKLLDISIQVADLHLTDNQSLYSQPVAVWAVGWNGDVLCRRGVTPSTPQGAYWQHIPTATDQPFQAISVGGEFRVWAIAKDGSAWFRCGVSLNNPAGNCWFHVIPPPPCDHVLHQISVGVTSVWAVDIQSNLWFRNDITPIFPEGTCWTKIASQVRRVSVGPKDQLWVVVEAGFMKSVTEGGSVYQRLGITAECPTGTGWQKVIGGGWQHVSIRGCMEDMIVPAISI